MASEASRETVLREDELFINRCYPDESMTLIELFGASVISFLIVVVGTYLGVFLALRAFFGASSWQEVSPSETDGT